MFYLVLGLSPGLQSHYTSAVHPSPKQAHFKAGTGLLRHSLSPVLCDSLLWKRCHHFLFPDHLLTNILLSLGQACTSVLTDTLHCTPPCSPGCFLQKPGCLSPEAQPELRIMSSSSGVNSSEARGAWFAVLHSADSKLLSQHSSEPAFSGFHTSGGFRFEVLTLPVNSLGYHGRRTSFTPSGTQANG